MRNFTSSHGDHGSKRRELAQHSTLPWIARIHSHTYINTVTTHIVRSASSAITQFGVRFLFYSHVLS